MRIDSKTKRFSAHAEGPFFLCNTFPSPSKKLPIPLALNPPLSMSNFTSDSLVLTQAELQIQLRQGGMTMRQLDWHMIFFISISLAQDYWILRGIPQIYYYEAKREHLK